MLLRRFLRRHRTAVASAVVVVLAAGALVAYALSSQGYPVRHVDLNDGGIWVTSDKDGLFGRLNKPAATLDAALSPPGGVQSGYKLDIVQDGSAVAAWDEASGVLLPVDVAKATAVTDAGAKVASGSVVAMAGGTVAVLDPASGKVWAVHEDPTGQLAGATALDPSAPPVGNAGSATTENGKAALAVGVDGTVYVASAGGRLMTIARTATGYAKPVSSDTGLPSKDPQVTAVGDEAVVLDPASGRLALPGGRSASVPADAQSRLQVPSAGRSSVVVASSKRLVSVPLAGGDPTTLFTVPSTVTGAAAPTWLQGCLHAAWSGDAGVYARSCDGGPARQLSLGDGALTTPVFRVNRNAIALNDTASGKVWDVDADPQRVDNWEAVKPPPTEQDSDKDKNDNTTKASQDQPPKAADDKLGARPGRTTVLHVLDNDSDPQGYILSVRSVTAPSDPSATLSISPDGQTVEITTSSTPSDVQFGYTIDDGKGQTATANVLVLARPLAQNEAPTLRVGYQSPAWTVPAGGRLSLPLLADWRDFDGDPMFVSSVDSAGVGTVSSTPDGRIEVIAPPKAGAMTVDYQVSDGVAATPQSATVTVLDPASTTTVAPVAQADVARGQVGRPIVIRPLDNDLAGADPTNPSAVLTLAGAVASPAGTSVVTDVKAGTVTITAQRAGVVPLTYSAAYGNAPFGNGAIRVDVEDAPATPQPPVAMPDTGVLYGQNPAIIDVLANDFDPAGAVLVVQHAEPVDTTSKVQVAILSGHWLRVTASSGVPSATPIVLHYTLADGIAASVTGEVTLTTQPKPASDVPVTRDDVAVVRAGDSVLVPVLDNDSTPAGSPLSLLPVVKGLDKQYRAGQLRTTTVDGKTDGIGAAYVAGNLVRYVPPATVTAPTAALIDYVAVNPDGQQAVGHLRVTVNPVGTNAPPVPQALEARVVAGDTVTVNVPTTGVDPDGDSVSVTGISVPDGATPPTLGRITKISATTLDYQAFPSASTGGTDTFTYRVTDRFGGVGEATVRIAVVQPGDPQPPVAVDDAITAAPGAALSVAVLANDLRSADDTVSIEDLAKTNPDLAGGATLDPATELISVKAPAANGKPLVVLYGVTNGLGSPSIGTLTVRSVADYNNPPIAMDAYAQPEDKAASVTVDVLSRDDDVDGDPSDMTITLPGVKGASVAGGKVTLPVTDQPQTVPYQVEDADGAVAAAVIHVPASGTGAPFVKAGKLIRVDQGKTATVDVNDYVTDPAGKKLSLTLTDRVWAAPAAGLSAKAASGSTLTLTGLADYVGPAAVTFEVTDGKTVDDPNGVTGYVTVPVQVGPETPVLRCPGSVVDVVEGGQDVGLDVTSLCHVWVADPSTKQNLSYTVAWDKQVANVDILKSGSHVPALQAKGNAVPGASGTLKITVDGTSAVAASLSVTVVKAPPPTIAPISVQGFKASDTASFDLSGYVTSQLRDPAITVVSVAKTDGDAATATANGATVQIKPGADSHGTIGFSVVVSDVADKTRTDRQVTGRIVLDVLNVPDAPSAPEPDRSVISHVVQLSWTPPAANGAPIDYYTVTWSGGQQQCAASPCAITGLTNGQQYSFTVTAHNAVGDSKPSPSSASAQPNAVPEAVTNLAVADPEDRTVTLKWIAAHVDGTAVQKYLVAWDGGGSMTVDGSATTAKPAGLINDNTYTFTVTPVNQLGPGPGAAVPGQSSGAPSAPTGLAFTNANAADGNTRVVTLSWDAADPNGIGPTTYTVSRTGGSGGAKTLCTATQQTSCDDAGVSNDGSTYQYTVTAANQPASQKPGSHTSPASASLSVEASATPDPISNFRATATGQDGTASLTFSVPPSHGASSTVICTVNGAACGRWTYPTRGAVNQTQTIQGLSNGTNSTVELVLDNGSAGGAGAGNSRSTPAQASVVTFGPIKNLQITTSVRGPFVDYTVSVDPNGKSVVVGVQSQVSGYQTYTTGTQPWSFTHTDRVGYDFGVLMQANAGDADNQRTSVNASSSNRTPPAPTLAVSPGSYATNTTYCTSKSCRYINVSIRNFTPGGSVTIYYDTDCAGGNAAAQAACNGQGNSGQIHYTSATYTLDGNGNADIADRLFGYTGSRVWVDADVFDGHFESNHAQF